MTEKNAWLDVQVAALRCPFLHHAITLVESGHATHEEALILVVLALSKDRQRLIDAEIQRLAMTT